MGDRGHEELSFHCQACGARFESSPGRIEPRPEREWQPNDYFAKCACGREAAQAAWELNLAKAWVNATGPQTPEGIAKVSKNLRPLTPEETKRTRFNAMKSGVFAKTAQYWPAKPGKYPHCATCEHFNKGCNDDNHRSGAHQNPPACLKRIELFMDYQIAFDARDPKMLTKYHSSMQALAWQLTNDMILQVIQDGVSLKSPEWYYDKDGGFHLAQSVKDDGTVEQIYKVESHPLLRSIIEFMNRNGMTLPDSGMTMKVKEEADDIKGFLEQTEAQRENALEFQQRQTKALEGLAALVDRSHQRMARDPVLIEHASIEKQEEGPSSP